MNRPAWLIDVKGKCDIRARPDMPYFALSYVWGTGPSDWTTSKNIGDLQEPGGLTKHFDLPRTVADVVGLMGLLGYGYLWVDRFCIIQDGGPEKKAELDRMGSLYGGAVATIVAARGT